MKTIALSVDEFVSSKSDNYFFKANSPKY
jgi:hypothetical protein